MVERLGSCLLLVLAFSGAAYGAGRHERWKAVEQLAPGKPIEVEVRGLAGVESCRLVSVDDSALTCVREQDPYATWDAASGARLVFPRAAVANVWLMEPEGHKDRIWIGMIFGFVLGAGACAGGGPGAALICAGLGAFFGAVVGFDGLPDASPGGFGPVYSPRRLSPMGRFGPAYSQRRLSPPELHPRLMYRAPAVAPASP